VLEFVNDSERSRKRSPIINGLRSSATLDGYQVYVPDQIDDFSDIELRLTRSSPALMKISLLDAEMFSSAGALHRHGVRSLVLFLII
jgi:hypothetical protein